MFAKENTDGNINATAAFLPLADRASRTVFPLRVQNEENNIYKLDGKYRRKSGRRCGQQDICDNVSGGQDARFETSHAEKPGELWSAFSAAFFLDDGRPGHRIGRGLFVRDRDGLRRDLSFTDSISRMILSSP
jgi:hypothetical protein